MEPVTYGISVVRRHLAFVCLLLAASGLRLMVSLAYRPALMFQSDSYVYVRKAVELEPSHHRPILYSLFLKPFLALKSVLAAVTVQHLLILALVVLLYVFLRHRGTPTHYAALGITPLALDAYQLDIEHYVLGEALFQVLSTTGLIVLLWRSRLTVGAALMAGGLIGLSGITRFLGVTLLLPAVWYAWHRATWRHALTLAVATAIPLLLYASWFNSHVGTFALTDRNGHFLYGRVAVFADCIDLDVPSYQQVLCDDRPIAERENPNFYVFDRESPAANVDVPEGMTRDAVLQDYARAVISQQPWRYARTVSAGLLHYFDPVRATGIHDNRLEHWRFPLDSDHAQPQAFLVKRFEGSPPPEIDPARFTVSSSAARALRWYQAWGYMHGPLLALTIVIAVAGAIRLAPAQRSEIAVLLGSGVLLLAIPVATVTFDYRFMLLTLPLIPPAAALAAARDRDGSVAEGLT